MLQFTDTCSISEDITSSTESTSEDNTNTSNKRPLDLPAAGSAPKRLRTEPTAPDAPTGPRHLAVMHLQSAITDLKITFLNKLASLMPEDELVAWLEDVGMMQPEGGSAVASHRGLGHAWGGWDWRDAIPEEY